MKKLLLAFAMIPLNLLGQATLIKILVPIAVNEPIPGAYGSQWVSILTMYNSGDTVNGVTNTIRFALSKRATFPCCNLAE